MLSTMELIVALKGISLFADIRGEGLKRISDVVHVMHAEPGELIFSEHDRGDEMYMIHSGKVYLFTGRAPNESLVVMLDAGGYFGELAIIDNQPRSTSARAAEKSTLLVLRKRDFRIAVLDYPDIAFTVFEEFARRLREANDQLRLLSDNHENS